MVPFVSPDTVIGLDGRRWPSRRPATRSPCTSVIAEPPSEAGGVKRHDRLAFDRNVAEHVGGRPGQRPSASPALDGAEAALVPTAFVAVTVNV